MRETRQQLRDVRREHPIFFWGTLLVLVLLLGATTAIALRIPRYQREAALLDRRMTETERQMRDRILDSRARRGELAVALLSRELRLRALEQEGVHLAISVEDSTLALRHGSATLREIPIRIGPDSTIRAPDGRTWRFVRALGERHLQDKEVEPEYTIPEWVYIGRGEPVPPEQQRRMEGAMGDYVLRLDDGTEIYSQPEAGPFAEHPKPGAFMAGEDDLRAIYDAVKVETPVYIY